jgi:hypothetical protein
MDAHIHTHVHRYFSVLLAIRNITGGFVKFVVGAQFVKYWLSCEPATLGVYSRVTLQLCPLKEELVYRSLENKGMKRYIPAKVYFCFNLNILSKMKEIDFHVTSILHSPKTFSKCIRKQLGMWLTS